MKQISITALFFILLVPVLIGMGVLLFLFSSNRSAAARQPSGEPAKEVIRPPLSADLHEISGTVLTRLPPQEDFIIANENTYIYVNAQVKTLAQSRVRIDLSNGSTVRLGENTLFTLLEQSTTPQGIFYKIRLTVGDLWVILRGGELEVETPSGMAAVRGSYLSVSYHPENNVSRVTCLEGNCSLWNDAGRVNLVAGQSAYVHASEVPPVIEGMEQEDVVEWLLNNPEAVLVMTPFAETRQALPTMTAGPSLTPPFTFTPGPSPTPTATRTFTPSPTSTASSTPTVTASATPSITLTATITETASITPSATISSTPTKTPTYTKTLPPTKSFTPSMTSTPVKLTSTPSKTYTPSLTKTQVTYTASPTQTQTRTASPTHTKTPTRTLTPTPTQTPTRTFTPTNAGFCGSVTEISYTECAALVALYNSTNGSGWTNKTGWLANNTPCSWYGVTCSSGHVTGLVLHSNNLSGSLPAEIGDLTYLRSLFLNSNQLSGSIPSQIGNLTQLIQLYLDTNELSGSLPTSIGNLTALQTLMVSVNQLSGAIPSSIMNLTSLSTIRVGGGSNTLDADTTDATVRNWLTSKDANWTGN